MTINFCREHTAWVIIALAAIIVGCSRAKHRVTGESREHASPRQEDVRVAPNQCNQSTGTLPYGVTASEATEDGEIGRAEHGQPATCGGPSQTVAAEGELELFVLPDRECRRRGNVAQTCYYKGMPIVIMGRLVNVRAKRGEQGAAGVEVPADWSKHVDLTIASPSTGRDSARVTPVSAVVPGETKTGRIVLRNQVLHAKWLLHTDRLRQGKYVITVEYRGTAEKQILVDLLPTETRTDRERVAARRAWTAYQIGQFGEAIAQATQTMEEYGRMASDGNARAIEVLGLSLERSGRLREALSVFEESLRSNEPSGSRGEPYLLKLKIEELRRKLQGPEVPREAAE